MASNKQPPVFNPDEGDATTMRNGRMILRYGDGRKGKAGACGLSELEW